MRKVKVKMKQKYNERPGAVRHVSLEEYYGTATEDVVENKVDTLLKKAIEASLDSPNGLEMDLDELDAYILANAR